MKILHDFRDFVFRVLVRLLLGQVPLKWTLTDKQGRSIISGDFNLDEVPITFKVPKRHVYRPGLLQITRGKGRAPTPAKDLPDQ